MNDEIKEILSCLNSSSWYYEANKLLEHIINLQQENERLKEENQNLLEEIHKATISSYEQGQQDWKELNKDYKSRCEKAIEYINDILYPIGTCVNGSDLPYESIESLLNILKI